MKKIISLIFLFVAISGFAQDKNFTLSGKVSGLESKPFRIFYKDASQPRGYFSDTISVNSDGSFSYSFHVNEMMYITASPGVDRVIKRAKNGKGFYPAKSSQLQFIAKPGGKVYVTGKVTDFVDAYPSGDKDNDDLARLNRQINPLANKSVNMMIEIGDRYESDEPEVKKTRSEMDKLDNQIIDIKKKFIQEHTSSAAAAWLLSDMMIRSQVTNDEAIDFFKGMDKEKLVSTPFYVEVAKRVDGITATAIGNEVPDISSSNTYDKKKFDLKSLRGKYVVLDFWGTWCGPCVSGMPKMKEYLDKYKGKLELVGVAQESDDGTQWRNFLNKNTNYQWHQVLSRDNEDYILKFSVAGFPTKIIVDPRGKIVQRFVGEDDAIYNKLDELLK